MCIVTSMLNTFVKIPERDTVVARTSSPSVSLPGCGRRRRQCAGPLFGWLGQDRPGLLHCQYSAGPTVQNHQRTHGTTHNCGNVLFWGPLISDMVVFSCLLGADRERLGFLWAQVLPQVSNWVCLQQCWQSKTLFYLIRQVHMLMHARVLGSGWAEVRCCEATVGHG